MANILSLRFHRYPLLFLLLVIRSCDLMKFAVFGGRYLSNFVKISFSSSFCGFWSVFFFSILLNFDCRALTRSWNFFFWGVVTLGEMGWLGGGDSIVGLSADSLWSTAKKKVTLKYHEILGWWYENQMVTNKTDTFFSEAWLFIWIYFHEFHKLFEWYCLKITVIWRNPDWDEVIFVMSTLCLLITWCPQAAQYLQTQYWVMYECMISGTGTTRVDIL